MCLGVSVSLFNFLCSHTNQIEANIACILLIRASALDVERELRN